MKLNNHFSNFLRDTVNLNQTRLDALNTSSASIKNFLRASDYEPKILRFVDQGSWAHGTIIKPLSGQAFDADLVMFVDAVDGWEAKDYINGLVRVFRASETYKAKIRSYSHCVTIEYAGERKLDIAPCVMGRGGIERFEVCNRVANGFEITDPEAYTAWVNERNLWAKGNSLKKSVRLLKYQRDIKTTFTCPSVLLTTLVGGRINALDQYTDGFIDTPTAFKTLMGRLDDWLQQQNCVPLVTNPILTTVEDFAGGWDLVKFNNFRNQIHRYRCWVDEAYDEADRNQSIAKWRRVFGNEFAKSVDVAEAKSVVQQAVQGLREAGEQVPGLINDIVDLVARFGANAIPRGLTRLPYLDEPTWPVLGGAGITVRIRGTLHTSKLGAQVRDIDLDPLPKGHWVRLEALNSAGMPLGKDFVVKWRIANTGEEAAQQNGLRGSFYFSDTPGVRWESLSYRGVHFVEAFVIRIRDGAQIGKSDPLYIVIA